MTARPAPPPSLPFGSQAYELLCDDLVGQREMQIRSRDARPLRVGDICTLNHRGGFYEVVVTNFTDHGPEGWSVRCRVVESQGA